MHQLCRDFLHRYLIINGQLCVTGLLLVTFIITSSLLINLCMLTL